MDNERGPAAAIKKAVEGAEVVEESIVEWLTRLAGLSSGEYENCRKPEAKMRGWRTATLDREVAALRQRDDDGNDLGLFDPAPWPEEVDGDEPGEKAAEEAASRFYREGRRVKIARPPKGMDFNDLLQLPSDVAVISDQRRRANG